MAEERPLSDLSIEERAARDAVDRDEEGNLVPHVYHPEIKEFHDERKRIDSDYVEPSGESVERREEAQDRAKHKRARG